MLQLSPSYKFLYTFCVSLFCDLLFKILIFVAKKMAFSNLSPIPFQNPKLIIKDGLGDFPNPNEDEVKLEICKSKILIPFIINYQSLVFLDPRMSSNIL